jgi:hypothetical protein
MAGGQSVCGFLNNQATKKQSFIDAFASAGKTGVPQVSKPAVSPISKSAGRQKCAAFAGLETRDTADLEVCGTGLPVK